MFAMHAPQAIVAVIFTLQPLTYSVHFLFLTFKHSKKSFKNNHFKTFFIQFSFLADLDSSFQRFRNLKISCLTTPSEKRPSDKYNSGYVQHNMPQIMLNDHCLLLNNTLLQIACLNTHQRDIIMNFFRSSAKSLVLL